MSQSGRDLIAQALARRALMGGAAMAGERELRPLFGQTAPATGLLDPTWRRQFEMRRHEDNMLDPNAIVDEPLYRPDIVPADQPTGERGRYYDVPMKRRL